MMRTTLSLHSEETLAKKGELPKVTETLQKTSQLLGNSRPECPGIFEIQAILTQASSPTFVILTSCGHCCLCPQGAMEAGQSTVKRFKKFIVGKLWGTSTWILVIYRKTASIPREGGDLWDQGG